MENFAAIDFETANNERTSVCSVGVVIVRDGKIVDSFYSLIQPEPNYYCYWNTKVHGPKRSKSLSTPVLLVLKCANTKKPSLTSFSAVALPIPPLAPVTNATFTLHLKVNTRKGFLRV